MARELGKFPHEVGRMPFADVIDLVDLPNLAEKLRPVKDPSMDDLRSFRAAVEAANG